MAKSNFTAQVIWHPSALTDSVIQQRSAGRHPKCVVSLAVFERHKAVREADKELILREIELLHDMDEIEDRMRACRARKLSRMLGPNKTKKEQAELAEIVAEIKWLKLPYEVRQSIEAARAGRGKVDPLPIRTKRD